jgi:methylmalonyl-CoA/ethylmalonyl-CoA epimerase
VSQAKSFTIGKLNHVAIAVPDLEKAALTYRETLGARVSTPKPEPDHGVTTIFVELPNTKIELLQPLGANSPIAKFLERNPDGGMHHLCYEVEDISPPAISLRLRERACLAMGIRRSAPTASWCCFCTRKTSPAH